MKVHLITQGDSLGLTTMGTACGLDGDDIPYGESGYFGDENTLQKITCHKCKASAEFREMWAKVYPGKPHPFKAAAQEAIETKKMKAAMREARTEDAVEHILSLPWRARLRAMQTINKGHRAALRQNR